MTLDVLLLARYGRTGASSRLRLMQYLPGLDQYDIDVYPAPFLDEAYLREMYAGRSPSWARVLGFYSNYLRYLVSAREFDVIWIEKEVLPWVPYWIELRALGSLPLVIDFDDAWHLRYSGSTNRLVKLFLEQKLERLARRADYVVVANSFLRAWARQAGARRISSLPTVVDLRHYPVAELPPPNPFTIGWIGTPESSRYLDTIKGALERVVARENTRLLLVGADRSFLSHPNVEVRAWSEASEVSLLQRMHVGIMPLPDGTWEYGKSGYKLVQYMAANRPVIASPVGVNCDLVRPGVNGFFATSEDEWVKQIERFRGEQALISTLGSAGRRMVEESYSLKTNIPHIAEILLAAGASRHRTHHPAVKFRPTLINRIRHSIYLLFACLWIGLLWFHSLIARFLSSTEDWRSPFWMRRRP